MRDLGLSYADAMHGVQSAIKYEMEQRARDPMTEIKHLRVGIDSRAADMLGLVELLIQKGLFTAEEYVEQVRLSMNDELARYTEHVRETYGLADSVEFR